MVEVIWTKLAADQFERAVKYIQEEQGTFYASIVMNKIFESVEQLQDFQKSGTIEPLLKYKSEYRFLVA